VVSEVALIAHVRAMAQVVGAIGKSRDVAQVVGAGSGGLSPTPHY
jgi:hypothetical protein